MKFSMVLLLIVLEANQSRCWMDILFEIAVGFLEEYQGHNLVIYSQTIAEEKLFIANHFKMSNITIQTVVLRLGHKYTIKAISPEQPCPVVKLFRVTNMSSGWDNIVTLSSEENWSDVNIWLLSLANLSEENIELSSILSELHLDYHSRVFAFQVDHKYMNIYEVYKISKTDSEVQILNYGNWSIKNGLILSDENIWRRRIDLKQKNFMISSLPNMPYLTQVDDGCRNESCFKGIFADVFHELQRQMNFSYTLRKPEDGQWGGMREDGTWTGIIGQLVSGEVSVAPVDLTVTLLRSNVVDFLPALDRPHLRIFVANPSFQSVNYDAYVRPFQINAWIAVAATVLLVPPVLTLILIKGDSSAKFSLSSSYVLTSGSFFVYSGPLNHPSALSGKTCFFAILFLGTAVYYHWQAAIISYLSVSKTTLPFVTMEQNLIVVGGSAFVDNFKYSGVELYRRVWKERREPYENNFPKNKDEMTAMIHSDRSLAMMDNYMSRVYYADYINCSTVDIPTPYFSSQFAMPVQKGLPYLEAFSYHIKAIRETGTLDQIKASYKIPPQECAHSAGISLGFGHTLTAFLLLLFGIILSVVIFSVECIRKRSKKSKSILVHNEEILHQIELNERRIEYIMAKNAILRTKLPLSQ